MRATRVITFTLLAVCCTGCVVGQKYNYADVVANLTASGSSTVGVGAHDQRPYVLSGNKAPEVVGLLRGGYGNPFDVTTETGQPLADEMARAIAASLTKRGFQATLIPVSYRDSPEDVVERIKASPCDRFVLFTMREWRSDTYVNTGLHYDANLKVLDKTGRVLAVAAIQGADNLGGGFNTASYSKAVVPDAFRRKLEELLNKAEVIDALQPK